MVDTTAIVDPPLRVRLLLFDVEILQGKRSCHG